jgi:hypothetical protein
MRREAIYDANPNHRLLNTDRIGAADRENNFTAVYANNDVVSQRLRSVATFGDLAGALVGQGDGRRGTPIYVRVIVDGDVSRVLDLLVD